MRAKTLSFVVVGAVLLAGIGAVVAYAATSGSAWNSGWAMMGSRYAYKPAKATPVHTLAAARSEAQIFASRLGLRVDEVLQFKRNFYAKLVDSSGNGATEVLVDPSSGIVSLEYGPAMMWNTRYGMMKGAGAKMMGSYGASMMGGSGASMMGGSGNGSGSGSGMMGGSGNGYGSGMMGGSGNGSGGGMMGGSGGMMSGSSYGGTGTAGTTPSTAAKVSLASAHALAQRWLDRSEFGVKVETGGDAFPGYYTLETLKDGKITGMISVNATTGTVWAHWWHGEFVAWSAPH